MKKGVILISINDQQLCFSNRNIELEVPLGIHRGEFQREKSGGCKERADRLPGGTPAWKSESGPRENLKVSQGQGINPKGREETEQRDHPDTKQRSQAQEGLSFHQVWPLIDQISTCRGFKVMETRDSGRKVGSGDKPCPPQPTLHTEDKTGRCFLLC